LHYYKLETRNQGGKNRKRRGETEKKPPLQAHDVTKQSNDRKKPKQVGTRANTYLPGEGQGKLTPGVPHCNGRMKPKRGERAEERKGEKTRQRRRCGSHENSMPVSKKRVQTCFQDTPMGG